MTCSANPLVSWAFISYLQKQVARSKLTILFLGPPAERLAKGCPRMGSLAAEI